VHGAGGYAGVHGTSGDGYGVQGTSSSGPAVYGANTSETVASILADGGPGTAIHGHGGGGILPGSPAETGVLGTAAGTGTGVVAVAADGWGLISHSEGGNGIRGRGQLDGVIGESPGGKCGVVGFSGADEAPAGPVKTGVYGEATQDASARGVVGKSTAGQGVRGEATTGHGVRGGATTGIGVEAVATTGVALDVKGRANFSRSGRANVPANAKNVDITVPGGLGASANVLATLQIKRGNAHVIAARPNYPSAGKVRIYLSEVASTTASTPLAWFVFG
jgi:hypothetical protein